MCHLHRYRYACGDDTTERKECNTFLIKGLCPDPRPTVTDTINGPCKTCRLKGWSRMVSGWFSKKKE
ncbi:hypothetical protein MMC15_000564 [Xylographa vitiligo]|nr:hypothetical protein [Xylographa vitiligo]